MNMYWLVLVVVFLGGQIYATNWLDRYNQNPIETESTCKDVRFQDKCYYFGLSLEWWTGAMEQCKRIGYQLAQIQNTDEANFLAKALRRTAYRNFWIDATDDGHEGLWLTAAQKPAFIGWFSPGEPNGERWENCGELHIADDGTARMNDQFCREWRKYVCERKSQLVCPRGGYMDRCYWFSMHPSNWYQAREHCQSLGMRLARIGGAETSAFIASQMSTDSIWVDIRYGASTGAFTYSDGAALSGNWLSNAGLQPMAGQVMQKCGEIRAFGTDQGRVNGVDCMVMRHFVCERAPMATSSAGTSYEQTLGLPSGLSSSSAVRRRRAVFFQAKNNSTLVD